MVDILHGLSFDIEEGSVLGIVGESGSGKSTLGRTLVRLLEPAAGTIRFAGQDISHLDEAALRPLRRDLQVIFQDPLSSLNPRLTIGTIIGRPLLFHRLAGTAREARNMAAAALATVGLPEGFAMRYPHELSGGQRQRVGIARAIALKPRFVLADEIVSGLDVSSKAQILTLLERLKGELGLTVAFISHDLSVVRRLCDRVIVMRRRRDSGEPADQRALRFAAASLHGRAEGGDPVAGDRSGVARHKRLRKRRLNSCCGLSADRCLFRHKTVSGA